MKRRKWRLPMLELPDEREDGKVSREEQMDKLLTEHEVMWEELKEVYDDFWNARDKYYNYLVSNNFMELKDFHVYKMVLGRRNKK
jgi:methionyl-tRNA synthetase